MAIDYPELKQELETDPRAYGYAAYLQAGDMQGPADLLNLVRTGSNGGPAITIRKGALNVKELYESIIVPDMPALSGNPNSSQLSTERQYLAWLTGLAALETVRLLNDDGTNGPVATNLLAMFPAGTGTRTRLIALAQRPGSRAEELFGESVQVSFNDIIVALRDF